MTAGAIGTTARAMTAGDRIAASSRVNARAGLKFLRSPAARRIAAELALFISDAIGRKRRR